ncbi:hypothetical protein NR996_01710 [Lactobacillus rodentium]|uniref:Lreu-0056-like domain-containing protein n=1 Tax=Lactobacillus rodentium TaxID=947835 RepID=A0A2Z6T658_9LACO|nr:hypothetical protein [Lactobacillus rodentium]MCR1894128.1 hypothetical protein [Lactobacillus rodentium]GBG04424.1 hypothetical protein LrDSM24759_03380 [Lactobacillus rodentium]
MKKKTLYVFASTIGLLGVLTTGCSTSTNNSATKSNNVPQTTSKSSTAESTSTSTDKKVANISDKALAVIAFDISRPYTSMEDLDNANNNVYGTNYQGKMPTYNVSKSDAAKIRGTHYVNDVDTDSNSDVWFKRNGDKLYVTIYNTDLEEPELVTRTYSINKLVKENYNTTEQKEKIDKYANKLKDDQQKEAEHEAHSADLSKTNDKAIAVMAFAVNHDGYMDSLDNGSFHYGKHYPKGNPKIRGSQYIKGARDPIWFKCNGNNIEISTLYMGYDYDAEDANIKTTTYSLNDLVKKYYNTKQQREKVNSLADALKDDK